MSGVGVLVLLVLAAVWVTVIVVTAGWASRDGGAGPGRKILPFPDRPADPRRGRDRP